MPIWEGCGCKGQHSSQVVSQKCVKRLVDASCLSVRPHGTTQFPHDGFFMKCETDFFFFRKSVEKIQVSLKSDKNSFRFLLPDLEEEQNLQIKVNTGEEFLARILDAAACIKQLEPQLRRTTRYLRIRVGKVH
jgi:hypothetical protein